MSLNIRALHHCVSQSSGAPITTRFSPKKLRLVDGVPARQVAMVGADVV